MTKDLTSLTQALKVAGTCARVLRKPYWVLRSPEDTFTVVNELERPHPMFANFKEEEKVLQW